MDQRFRLPLKRFDYVIPVAAGVLVLIGLFTIQSTIVAGSDSNVALQTNLINVQLMAIAIGLLVFVLIGSINYEYLSYVSKILYLVAVALLLSVVLFADVTRGSIRWFQIGPVNFQPSSVTTLMFIIVFAQFFKEVGKKINKIQYLVASGVMLGIPMILLLLEPDLGSALIVLIIWSVLLHMSPIKPSRLVLLYGIGIMVLPIAISNLEPYQLARLTSFVNPQSDPSGTGYNVIQSIIAVGSGRLTGRGWGQGTQSHLQYLPEQHTDFIFASFAEEQGFLGAVVLVLLFLLILWRMYMIVVHSQNNTFGQLIAIGVLVWFAMHVFINIGMNIGIAPITGIPLPLVSYGGSAMITTWLALGLVESVYRNTELR